MRGPLLALAAAFLLAACGGSQETITLTEREPTTVFETVTQTVEPEPEQGSSYPPGFPKEVPIARVPDQMSDYSGAAEGLETAVALAPGVWAMRTPGTTVKENADLGSYFGWCASVEAFERRSGRGDMTACW